jgi:Domain of unknown function (DUF4390)
MNRQARFPCFPRRALPQMPRWLRVGWAPVLVLALLLGTLRPAFAQGVELAVLQVNRVENVLALEFALNATLPKPVQQALERGVPVYFVAEAQLLRSRWYWRDERVARVQRSWRLVFQPLTNTWRVSLGGLHQSFATLEEAMAAVTRIGAWRIAEQAQIEGDPKSYYLEFSWRLDSSQLPSPMQIGLPGAAGWALGIERVLRLE